MTSFKRIKKYFISYCISYTIASMILSALQYIYPVMTDINVWQFNIELSAVCLVIAVLMFFSDYLTDPSGEEKLTPLGFAIGFADVAVPVLGMGGPLFKWFDLFSAQILFPLIIIAAVYLATLALFIINDKLTEKAINRKINERKKKKKNEQQNN